MLLNEFLKARCHMDAQQKQIEQLRQELQTRDQAVQQLQQRLDQSQTAATQAQAKAESATAEVSKQEQSVTVLRTDVDDLKQNAGTTALTIQETQKNVKEAIESPTAIHYKGITITPGGFVAAETVTRQRATSADINTPFTGIPYSGNSLSKVFESNFTARQSRLTLLGESKVGSAKLTGYYEGDFLGTGVDQPESDVRTLAPGTYYFQCDPHAPLGMSGHMKVES